MFLLMTAPGLAGSMLMVTVANTGAVASIASARTLRFTTLMSSPFFCRCPPALLAALWRAGRACRSLTGRLSLAGRGAGPTVQQTGGVYPKYFDKTTRQNAPPPATTAFGKNSARPACVLVQILLLVA